jgi:hypothetical protein
MPEVMQCEVESDPGKEAVDEAGPVLHPLSQGGPS